MDTYTIFIFISSDKIYVFEVIDNATLKPIGFQGDEYYTYENNNDIEGLCDDLADHYNIDGLSDLKIHIQIIDCNAEKSAKSLLLSKLAECERLSVNCVDDLIPIILTQKKVPSGLESICVSFWGNDYTYRIIDKCYYLANGDAENKIDLKFNDFLLILFWCVCNADSYEEKIKEMESLLIEQGDKLKELDDKNVSLINSLELAEKELKELRHYKKNKELLEGRKVIRANNLPDDVYEKLFNNSGYYLFTHSNSRKEKLIIVEEVADGEYVSEGCEIAWLKKTIRKKSKTNWIIKAPCEGKIAWIYPNESNVWLENKVYPIVAVIGNYDDNVEDMRKWCCDNFDT